MTFDAVCVNELNLWRIIVRRLVQILTELSIHTHTHTQDFGVCSCMAKRRDTNNFSLVRFSSVQFHFHKLFDWNVHFMEGFGGCVVLFCVLFDWICQLYVMFIAYLSCGNSIQLFATSRSVVHVALMNSRSESTQHNKPVWSWRSLAHSTNLILRSVSVGLRHNSTKTPNIHTLRVDISITNIRYFSCTLLGKLFSKGDSGGKKTYSQPIPKKDSCHFDCNVMKAWKNPLSFRIIVGNHNVRCGF